MYQVGHPVRSGRVSDHKVGLVVIGGLGVILGLLCAFEVILRWLPT